LYAAFNEQDEARFVIERLMNWVDQEGLARSDVAILYRSNAQSRTFEEALLSRRIPYRVYGGLRFFERAEIKDALAYLRLMANRDDSAALERVINTPTRGIGNRTIEAIRLAAREQSVSLWAAAKGLVSHHGGLPARALTALGSFIGLIDRLATETADLSLADQRGTQLRAGCGD
jgi:DNA helicase-2/ATP-dependent DNA helicase PcrA